MDELITFLLQLSQVMALIALNAMFPIAILFVTIRAIIELHDEYQKRRLRRVLAIYQRKERPLYATQEGP